jgi:hypothetical protein
MIPLFGSSPHTAFSSENSFHSGSESNYDSLHSGRQVHIEEIVVLGDRNPMVEIKGFTFLQNICSRPADWMLGSKFRDEMTRRNDVIEGDDVEGGASLG